MPTHTWGSYRIVDNAIPATAFKVLKASRKPGEREENETDKGLRVQDKGFLNTAVIRSEITYIDGDAGGEFVSCPSSCCPLTCPKFYGTGEANEGLGPPVISC